MSPAIELQLAGERFAPGDRVSGSVVVTGGGGLRTLEVALEFHEKSPDYEEVPIRVPQTLHTGDVRTGQSLPFSLALPADALPGYSSANGELYWELDVKSDELGPDTHVRRRIEVVLHAVPEAEDIFAGGFDDES
ncbi:MAG: hypothetical protein ACRDM2_00625 [Gaiellaceae bacterium]